MWRVWLSDSAVIIMIRSVRFFRKFIEITTIILLAKIHNQDAATLMCREICWRQQKFTAVFKIIKT